MAEEEEEKEEEGRRKRRKGGDDEVLKVGEKFRLFEQRSSTCEEK